MKQEHNRRGVAEIIAERFIAELNKGVAPWASGFVNNEPRNAQTGKGYRGINYFLLSMLGVNNAITYKGATAMGGNVKKGAKGIPVVFWKWLDKKDDPTAKKIPMLRYYTVFDVKDCENVTPKMVDVQPGKDNVRNETAEKLFAAIQDACGFEVHNGGNQPCFIPALNQMEMPEFERWEQPSRFYKTLFHECGHALGKVVNHAFGRGEEYAKEELTAELFASVCLAHLGINSPDAWDNSVAYVQGWASKLGSEPQMIINAAQNAQKRLDIIFPKEQAEE